MSPINLNLNRNSLAAVFVLGLTACLPLDGNGGNLTCGDAVCDPAETATTCPEDCAVIDRCGDGICQAGEACDADCWIDDRAPDIVADASSLDFGCAPLMVDSVIAFTLTNLGDAALEITNLSIVEAGQNDEFSPNPVGDVTIVMQAGESIVISVTLNPQDTEADQGQLLISSNDPDEPVLTIELTTYCPPRLDLCALNAELINPEPFVNCVVDISTGDPLIDFGLVLIGTDTARLVT